MYMCKITSLAMSKSHVTPIKSITFPKLELMAVAIRLAQFVIYPTHILHEIFSVIIHLAMYTCGLTVK